MNRKAFFEELGITPGPWRIGTVLLTPVTKRWHKDEWDKMEEVENRQVFANFHGRDAGTGRWRVASTERKEDTHLIATAPKMLLALIEGVLMVESLKEFLTIDSVEYSFRDQSLDIILSATNNRFTWPEIKTIYEKHNSD